MRGKGKKAIWNGIRGSCDASAARNVFWLVHFDSLLSLNGLYNMLSPLRLALTSLRGSLLFVVAGIASVWEIFPTFVPLHHHHHHR